MIKELRIKRRTAKAPERTFGTSGTTVHDDVVAAGAPPGSDWMTLDLSAYVGKTQAFVWLRIKAANATKLIIKPYGDAGAIGVASYGDGTTSVNFNSLANAIAHLLAVTDNQGRISVWADVITEVWEIKLVAFITSVLS